MHQSGPVRHHVEDAVAPPRRDPLHLVIDGVLRRSAQRAALAVFARDGRVAVHAHEPLRRGQEDDRVVAAPAVRVLVLELLAVPQPGAPVQLLLDLRVGVEHAHPAKELHGVEEVAAGADGCVDLEPVLHPVRKSSAPWPGAVCTAPVPCSSVTYSPSTPIESRS
jgi:hypothetical protein